MKLQPVSTIKAELGINKGGAIEKFFTNTCYRYMDEFVPMDEGNLRTVVDIGSDYITYESQYAEYQYYGQRKDGTHKVVNYTTPGTGTYWDKRMVSAKFDQVLKEVQRKVNGL